MRAREQIKARPGYRGARARRASKGRRPDTPFPPSLRSSPPRPSTHRSGPAGQRASTPPVPGSSDLQRAAVVVRRRKMQRHESHPAGLFDIIETVSSLEPGARPMTSAALPRLSLELWFAEVLRDACAMTAANGYLDSPLDLDSSHELIEPTPALLQSASPLATAHPQGADGSSAAEGGFPQHQPWRRTTTPDPSLNVLRPTANRARTTSASPISPQPLQCVDPVGTPACCYPCRPAGRGPALSVPPDRREFVVTWPSVLRDESSWALPKARETRLR